MHVSRDNVQNIWVGNYINFAVLLKKVTETTTSTICIYSMNYLAQLTKPARVVQNIHEWTNAFRIYSAILMKKHPEKATHLLQYLALTHSHTMTPFDASRKEAL